MTPEGRVKAYVRKNLRTAGVMVIPINQQGIGVRGIPDDLLLYRGDAAFVEYKAHMVWGKNNVSALRTLPTVLQVKAMADIRSHGIAVFVVDDTTHETFAETVSGVVNFHDAALRPFLWDWTVSAFLAYRTADADELEGRLIYRVGLPTWRE